MVLCLAPRFDPVGTGIRTVVEVNNYKRRLGPTETKLPSKYSGQSTGNICTRLYRPTALVRCSMCVNDLFRAVDILVDTKVYPARIVQFFLYNPKSMIGTVTALRYSSLCMAFLTLTLFYLIN